MILELEGIFSSTPVTLKLNLPDIFLDWNSITSPIGLLSPKYFFAVWSVITIENGSINAVSGFPIFNGKVNTLKTEASEKRNCFPFVTFSPTLIREKGVE